MLSSISNSNQEQLEGYARQIQHFVNHQRTATELSDCLQNGPRPVPFSSHRPIIHQQYQLSSFQLGEQQQTTPCMLHPTLKVTSLFNYHNCSCYYLYKLYILTCLFRMKMRTRKTTTSGQLLMMARAMFHLMFAK